MDEFCAAVAACGVAADVPQVAALHAAADADGSGAIDYVEFLNLMWRLQGAPSAREMRAEMFAVRGRVRSCSAG